MEHIRKDPNKLYNYMIKLLLTEEFAKYSDVFFHVDQRAIKVKSGNSMHDYLQTVLWFDLGSETIIKTSQCDSKQYLCIQLADIFSGIVQNHFEDGKSEPYNRLVPHSEIKRLYFG